MHTFYLILALLAVVAFLAAAAITWRISRTDNIGRAISLIALGLAFWAAVDLIQLIRTA
jgi:hypothetical protein